jgi:hypothetical protein
MKTYQIDDVTLIRGDNLKALRKMKEDSVDLIITSPPYEDVRSYGSELNFKLTGDEYVEWCLERFMECLRVCKGVVAWVIDSKTKDYQYSMVAFELMVAIKNAGGIPRKPMVYKRVGVSGSGGPDWMRNDWEPILCFTKKRAKLSWSDNTACGEPPKYKPGGNMSQRGKDGSRAKPKKYKAPALANPGNVIDCGAAGGGHLGSNIAHETDAPFPEKIPNFFIRSFCPKDGVVLDPFVGSGTTIAAAIKARRKVIGIDVRPSQIKLCKRRIRQAEMNKGLGIV